MIKVISSVVLLIASTSMTFAGPPPDSAFWNDDRTAAVATTPVAAGTQVTAFLLQQDGTYLEIDLSAAEDVNFGKLGRHEIDYDRFETKAVEWISRSDGLLQVRIQTQAWRAGKRYTVSEPLIFRRDGTTVWR